MRASRRGWSGTDVVGLMVVLGLGILFLVPATRRAAERSGREKCGWRLRFLAMQAWSYAEDKRSYPSQATPTRLAGGPESDHAQRVIETLDYCGYIDEQEYWTCPSSSDTEVWGPYYHGARPAESPLVDALARPCLDESTTLSYGWTRRWLGPNAAPDTPLVADRALRRPDDWSVAHSPGRTGNHVGGVQVGLVDGSVRWVSDPEALRALVATDPADPRSGFMGIHDPSEPR